MNLLRTAWLIERKGVDHPIVWLAAPDHWTIFADEAKPFATNWLRNRGRLETLQLILGHESINTTSDLYGHLDMTDVELDMRLIETEA